LAEARDIVIIGYSLPPSDQFFRYLYGLGTISATRLRRFLVFDPDTRPALRRRFERLLGQAARERFDLRNVEFHTAIVKSAEALARP
jgi:hypothetical protein